MVQLKGTENGMEVNLIFKRILLILLLTYSGLVHCQESRKSYSSTNILEVFINTDESIIHHENQLNTGWGFEFNSLHGFFILKKILLSAGIGINFNIDEELKSLPAVLELKYNFSNYGLNSPYILLNTGKNLDIGSFLPGQTAKLGFGYNFESDSNFQYTIEMFKKSKTYYTSEISDVDYNYPADGYGISMGITF